MKSPLLFKLCIALSLVILGLAIYLLPSRPESPASESPRLSEAAPSNASPEPTALSSEPSPAAGESDAPDSPAVTPGPRTAIAPNNTATAAPIEHKGLAARRVAAGTAAASTSTAPGTAAAAAVDIDANAPLPVPLPAAIVSGEVLAALPLALVPPDPNQKLSDLQQMGLDSLRKGFIDAVGGPDQDPKDPEYLPRWLDATKRSDELYETMFGWEASAAQQRRAVKEAGGVKAFFEQRAATNR